MKYRVSRSLIHRDGKPTIRKDWGLESDDIEDVKKLRRRLYRLFGRDARVYLEIDTRED